MKKFEFTMYVKTSQGQQFDIGRRVVEATNQDEARKKLHRMHLPMHTFSTCKVI
jgi:hypothetical protein